MLVKEGGYFPELRKKAFSILTELPIIRGYPKSPQITQITTDFQFSKNVMRFF